MAKQKKTKQAVLPPDTKNTSLQTWWDAGILALLILVFFRDILLENAYFWEDFLYFTYPVRNFAATSMAMGTLPFWNPFSFSGMPFLADMQTTVFYLPCTLLALFVSHGMLNFYWLELLIIAHYVLAGVSMYWLARALGTHRTPALFAGAAYMLSGFMITHAIHQQIITLVAWYPLILLLFRRALLEKAWKWVFLAAITLGHSILAGHPQLSFYFFFFLLIYFLFELFTAYRGAAVFSQPAFLMTAKAATIVALSIGLVLIQILPTMELSGLSQRAQITYEKSAEGSLAWSHLLTLLFPKFFGTAGAGGYNYWGAASYWFYWETCIYLGILPLLLALLSGVLLKKNKYVAFFWGYAAFALLFSLGNNFPMHQLFYNYIPGFSTFRNPARIGIFLVLATSLLAGFSLQHLLYEERAVKESRLLRFTLIAVAAIGVSLWMIVVTNSGSGLFPFLKNPQTLATVKRDTFASLTILLLSCGLVYGIIQRASWKRWAGPALIVVFFGDMLLFGGEQNNATLNPAEYFSRAEPIVRFLKKEGQNEIFRVNTRNPQGMIMDRNQGMIDRIFMMEGYSPLALQRLQAPLASGDDMFDLLNVKYRTVTDEQARALNLALHPTYFPRAFFLYRLHVVHNEEELLAYLKSPEFDHRTIAVLEKDPGRTLEPTADSARGTARITGYSNNVITLDVRTSRDGLLVLSEMYYPGWKAFVDGTETEIYRTDYNLRGMFVPKGDHKIEVRMESDAFKRGGLVTLLSLVVCGAGLIVSGIRTKREAR